MIEQTGPGDAQEILEVINRANREAYRSIIPEPFFQEPVLSLEELQTYFAHMAFYVYRDVDRVLGVAALCQEGEESGSIYWVYVRPECQRQGIGTALITFLEGRARQIGLRWLRLRANERAYWAVDFYRKLGYHPAGRVEMPWGFDLKMEKDLGA